MVRSSVRNLLLAVAAALVPSAELFDSESCGVTLTLLKPSFETGEQSLYAEVSPDYAPLFVGVDYLLDGLATDSKTRIALRSGAFKSLGHAEHLLQDMAHVQQRRGGSLRRLSQVREERS